MSAYLTELGGEPMKVRALGVHIMNKKIGNGGNQYKKWAESPLGEVYLQVLGRIEVFAPNDEGRESIWIDNPIFKYLLGIKTWRNFEDVKKDTLTVIPVASGLDKPGILKVDSGPLLVPKYPSFKGDEVSRIQTQDGKYHVGRILEGAAVVTMWRELNVILAQTNDVDNQFWHNNDEEYPSPTCDICLHKTYVEPDDKSINEPTYEAVYFCAATGEPIDEFAADVGNTLESADHGLLHGHKGTFMTSGEKYVVGAKADDDSANASVRTGTGPITMSELREQSFLANAPKCRYYSPRRVLEERAQWSKTLEACFLPNTILRF